jgi:hypothetical protein
MMPLDQHGHDFIGAAMGSLPSQRQNRALARLMLDAVVGRVRRKAASSSALSALTELQLSNEAIRVGLVERDIERGYFKFCR